MTASPKRRWYQFSLKAMLVRMTAVGLVLGLSGRAVYMRQRTEFHDGEYLRCIDAIMEIYHQKHGEQAVDQETFDALMGPDGKTKIRLLVAHSQQHRVIAEACRTAVFRPWVTVDETLQENP